MDGKLQYEWVYLGRKHIPQLEGNIDLSVLLSGTVLFYMPMFRSWVEFTVLHLNIPPQEGRGIETAEVMWGPSSLRAPQSNYIVLILP